MPQPPLGGVAALGWLGQAEGRDRPRTGAGPPNDVRHPLHRARQFAAGGVESSPNARDLRHVAPWPESWGTSCTRAFELTAEAPGCGARSRFHYVTRVDELLELALEPAEASGRPAGRVS